MMREFSTQSLLAAPRAMLGAAALATVLAASPPSEAGVSWGGTKSGLPWASGANGGSGGMADLQAMRGRKLDVRTVFTRIDSWSGLIVSTPGVRSHLGDGAAIVVAFGMLPQSHRAQHAACARGNFDAQMRSFGQGLVANGAARAVLRLGWEANRLNGYPWAVTGDGGDYKSCFRRWVSVLRSVPGQRFAIDWNMQDKSVFPPAGMYPGNDVVDIVGVNVYDRCPPMRTEAEWSSYFNSRHKDGRNPRGLASWLQFARQRGKKLSIPEWGVGGPSVVKLCTAPGFDNAFFIRKMHEFLRANAASIAYEAYFNGHGYTSDRRGSHKLAPVRYNPKAAAAYKGLWGG